MSRLRQAVLVASDLDAMVVELRSELDLGEPFSDPAVGYFGLQNAVFAVGDQFLEIVSPVKPDTAAGRLIERRGSDCGYMAMFQVDALADARLRAKEEGVREVFEVDLDDIVEAHLHPADMKGAIVSVSEPRPADSWRWGGPGWRERSVPGEIVGLKVAVADPAGTGERWRGVIGGSLPVTFVEDASEAGIVEIHVERAGELVAISP